MRPCITCFFLSRAIFPAKIDASAQEDSELGRGQVIGWFCNHPNYPKVPENLHQCPPKRLQKGYGMPVNSLGKCVFADDKLAFAFVDSCGGNSIHWG